MVTEAGGKDMWKSQSIEVFCRVQDYRVKIEREGCQTNHFTVKACLGNCRSFELPLQDVPYFTSKCQTCTASEFTNKKFQLTNCTNPYVERSVVIESAVSCSCKTSPCY